MGEKVALAAVYTLDTNAVIYYLAKDSPVTERIDAAIARNTIFYLSAITIVELLRFDKLTAKDEFAIQMFLSICSVINVDVPLATHAATIGRTYKLRLPDSVIAATAAFTGSTLLTRNVRDFKKVPYLIVQPV